MLIYILASNTWGPACSFVCSCPLISKWSIHTGKTANGPFLSFVKCASREVRGKVLPTLIPIPLPLLIENQECLSLKSIWTHQWRLPDSCVYQRVSEARKWLQLSFFPWNSKKWHCRVAKSSELHCDCFLGPASALLMGFMRLGELFSILVVKIR